MATDDGLRYVDSDGHILEHPTAMPQYAPAEYRDRIWHIETDEAGEEWLLYQGNRPRRTGWPRPGSPGERRGPRPRVPRGDALHGDASGGLERQGPPPRHGPGRHRPRRAVSDDAARAPERAPTSTSPRRRPAPTTTGAPTTSPEGEGRLFGAGAVPPMHEPKTSSGVAAEIRRVADAARHGVGVHPPEPGRSTGGRSTTRSTTRSGRPRPTPGCRSRCTLPRRRPARHVHGPAPEPAPGPTAGTSTTTTPSANRATTSSRSTPSCARPTSSPRRIANPFDMMSSDPFLTPAACASASPT